MKKYSNNPLEKCIVSINVSSFLNYFDVFCNLSSTNYQIADELEMPLSSVCARVRELQLLELIEDSGHRRETPYGKTAIVWQRKE